MAPLDMICRKARHLTMMLRGRRASTISKTSMWHLPRGAPRRYLWGFQVLAMHVPQYESRLQNQK